MGKKALTQEEWLVAARAAHPVGYDYSRAVYTKYGHPVVIGCPVHGWFTQKENNHRNGAGCPKCGVQRRAKGRAYDFTSFLEKAREVHGDKYEYEPVEIVNSRSKIRFKCAAHGWMDHQVYKHVAGHGCKKCASERLGRTSQLGISEFIRRANAVHGGKYGYVSGLSGLHNRISIKCPIHGVFRQIANNHLKGAGCPKCTHHVSKGEIEVANFIESIVGGVRTSVTGVIGRYELDIYVPSKNFAVEYNGLHYHHELHVGNKHRIKWELCNEKGIKLIQVFEDEWKHDTDKVKARISAILGVCDKFSARACKVVSPPASTCRKFLEERHMQGCGTTLKYAYGLEHNGVLVALATFGKARFKNGGWELQRYASIGRVRGGISKLVTAFYRDTKCDQIVSYADLRWGDGEAYRSAGFTFHSITEPDYWWSDTSACVRHSRYKLQPHKVGMPEKEYAKLKGYKKILGVGHKKWIWHAPCAIRNSSPGQPD